MGTVGLGSTHIGLYSGLLMGFDDADGRNHWRFIQLRSPKVGFSGDGFGKGSESGGGGFGSFGGENNDKRKMSEYYLEMLKTYPSDSLNVEAGKCCTGFAAILRTFLTGSLIAMNNIYCDILLMLALFSYTVWDEFQHKLLNKVEESQTTIDLVVTMRTVYWLMGMDFICLHVGLTMFTGFVVGYFAFRALFDHNPALSAAGGIFGLIAGLLVESLFIIRASSQDLKSTAPTSNPKKDHQTPATAVRVAEVELKLHMYLSFLSHARGIQRMLRGVGMRNFHVGPHGQGAPRGAFEESRQVITWGRRYRFGAKLLRDVAWYSDHTLPVTRGKSQRSPITPE
ncbi:hypothetical protein FNV43_RR10145 [Rhamnella rubrinervis]|uniref:Uncharacterized protein n=1 Tax=Rhamnella rubrinervis TaxID=2594499 RepID=A0A8K0HBA5_9ROSA|nr:hypothetical protein FNV43_RR10145 [Rhamnella rubrinervis]